MSKYGRWFKSSLGWAIKGAIGRAIDRGLEAFLEGLAGTDPKTSSKQKTEKGDFAIALVILAGVVMNANGKKLKSELDYIKEFFKRNYGIDKTKELMLVLRDTIDKVNSIRQVCLQIKDNLSHAVRLQLFHFLVGVAKADGTIDEAELAILKQIAGYLGINNFDFESVKAMFVWSDDSNYKVLEIEKTATNDEVKKAYRKMAAKYHPDKVAHLGDEVVKRAKEKFQQLTNAYEVIKKERGIK